MPMQDKKHCVTMAWALCRIFQMVWACEQSLSLKLSVKPSRHSGPPRKLWYFSWRCLVEMLPWTGRRRSLLPTCRRRCGLRSALNYMYFVFGVIEWSCLLELFCFSWYVHTLQAMPLPKFVVTGFVQFVRNHFVAFVRRGGKWYKRDDSRVTRVDDIPQIWPILIFLEKFRKQRLHQAEADSSVQNNLPISRLPVLIREILTADASSRNLAPDTTSPTSQSRSRKTRRLQYTSLVRKAVCRQERKHSAHDVSVEEHSAKRRKQKQSRSGRTQDRSRRMQKNRSGRTQTQNRSGRTQTQNRSGRTQTRNRSGRTQTQNRSGRTQTQNRSGRTQTQNRSGRTQNRSGRQQMEKDDDRDNRERKKESQRRQAETFGGSKSSNADGRREDRWSQEDNPFNRFKSQRKLFRNNSEEDLRVWPLAAVQMSPQPCLLCEADHEYREDLLEHIEEKHGGLQRYRNAMLMLESLCPHVVVGSEVRQYVSNYATFLRESKMDWEKGAHDSLRCRVGCAFCARSFWKEELWEVHLTGELGFMQNADAVWKLLSVDRYQQRWPMIPAEELLASSVTVVGSDRQRVQVLLHKRRVTDDMACGKCPTLVCQDCWRAFSPKKPQLCRFALANDMWLGRIDPLLWQANMTHEMCLALARTVATKVVLRAGGAQQTGCNNGHQWDHAFHQSGYVGSSVVFHNGDAKHALESLPPQKLNDAFAITFCTDLPQDGQDSGRAAVSKIVGLRLKKNLFLQQAERLLATNPVYAAGVKEINRELLTEWMAGAEELVPPVVLDCVVSVPVGEEGPGIMRQEGPAQATDGHIKGNQEETVFAMEPEAKDYNEEQTEVGAKVAMLLEKLDELEAAGARSVSVEVATRMGEDTTLVDHVGRKRILDLVDDIQDTCRKLSTDEARTKLEKELSYAVMGKSSWLLPDAHDQQGHDAAAEASKHLLVARGKKLLSLFDWKIWTMAKPRLWRFGDAAFIWSGRTVVNAWVGSQLAVAGSA